MNLSRGVRARPVRQNGLTTSLLVERRKQRCIAMLIVRCSLLTALCTCLVSCSSLTTATKSMSPRDQVLEAERGFAATMAERDLAAFAAFVDDEAIFFTGSEPLRGKERVVEWWSRYFEDADAPFSWEPDEVEVLPSGTLAHSSGPVRSPEGKIVARFNSIWRQQSPGVWRIVFDKGSPLPVQSPSP